MGNEILMDIDTELQEMAQSVARQLKKKVPRLRREIEDIEKRKAKIMADLESATRGEYLAAQYRVYIDEGRERRCPSCWVFKEITNVLRPIEGSGAADRFRCVGCENSFAGRA